MKTTRCSSIWEREVFGNIFLLGGGVRFTPEERQEERPGVAQERGEEEMVRRAAVGL